MLIWNASSPIFWHTPVSQDALCGYGLTRNGMTQMDRKGNYSVVEQCSFLCASTLHFSHLQHGIVCLLMVFVHIRLWVFQDQGFIMCIYSFYREASGCFCIMCENKYKRAKKLSLPRLVNICKLWNSNITIELFIYYVFNKVKSDLQPCAFPY